MGRFDSAQKLAQKLIAKYGETSKLTVFTTIDDPDKPWLSGQAGEQSVFVRAVYLNYDNMDAGMTFSEGSEIQRDDKKVLIAAKGLPIDPNLQGTITRADGRVLRIVKMKLLDPDGQKILFELQARV